MLVVDVVSMVDIVRFLILLLSSWVHYHDVYHAR